MSGHRRNRKRRLDLEEKVQKLQEDLRNLVKCMKPSERRERHRRRVQSPSPSPSLSSTSSSERRSRSRSRSSVRRRRRVLFPSTDSESEISEGPAEAARLRGNSVDSPRKY